MDEEKIKEKMRSLYGYSESGLDAERQKTLGKIEQEQLTEDFPREFEEFKDLYDDPTNEHPSEAFDTSDQISSEEDAYESPDVRFSKDHEPIVDVSNKEQSLRESLKMKTDKPSDETPTD